MSVFGARRPAEENGPPITAEVEGETRGWARKEFAAARPPLPLAARLPLQAVEGDDREVGQVNLLIRRVAGASVLEIEKLVGDLQELRDFLHGEADRVQRQITGFVHLSDAAMKSTQIIADSVSQRRGAVDGGEQNGFESSQEHTAQAANPQDHD